MADEQTPEKKPAEPNKSNGTQKRPLLSQKRLRNKSPKQPYRGDNDEFNWGKALRVVLSWSAIIMGVFVVMTMFKGQEGTEYEISFTQYQEFLQGNKITKATIKKSNLNDYDFHGALNEPQETTTGASMSPGRTRRLGRSSMT